MSSSYPSIIHRSDLLDDQFKNDSTSIGLFDTTGDSLSGGGSV